MMRRGLRLSVPVEAPPGETAPGETEIPEPLSEQDPSAGLVGRARDYGELTAMLERLHRRYLDVVRLGLESIGVNDINASQALILMNVGEGEVPIRDLVQRGYYLASSASYNIKKLVDYGYLEQIRSQHDRRSVRLKLGDQGRMVVARLKELDHTLAEMSADEPGLLDQVEHATKTMRRLERVWAEFINFG